MGSEIDFRFLPGRAVHIHMQDGDVIRVLEMLPLHLMAEEGWSTQPQGLPRMIIDVGATSPEEVRDMGIQPIDTVTRDKTFNIMRGNIICAKSLDNRHACGIVLEVIKGIHRNNFNLSVTFA